MSKLEGKTIFSRRPKQFDGLTSLTLTLVFYDDRSTYATGLCDEERGERGADGGWTSKTGNHRVPKSIARALAVRPRAGNPPVT